MIDAAAKRQPLAQVFLVSEAFTTMTCDRYGALNHHVDDSEGSRGRALYRRSKHIKTLNLEVDLPVTGDDYLVLGEMKHMVAIGTDTWPPRTSAAAS